MRGGEHAAGPVEHGAEVIAAAPLDLTHIDRHPDGERTGFAPARGRELSLGLAGGGDGCADVRERDVHAVADAFDNPAACGLDGAEDDAVVLTDGRPHCLRVQFPQHRRVLDVGEQERNRLHLRLGLEQQRLVVVEDPPLQLLQLR